MLICFLHLEFTISMQEILQRCMYDFNHSNTLFISKFECNDLEEKKERENGFFYMLASDWIW